MSYDQLAEDYRRVEQAIRFLGENHRRQPTLAEVAGQVGLSEYHFQRLFARWVGISPKRFLQFLTKEHAKALLARPRDLLEVTYATGLSSPGRLHELFVTCEAVTPGEFKSQGAGLTIVYGFQPSPFGECLLAQTERGICGLSFVPPGGHEQALATLHSRWRRAALREDAERIRPLVGRIFDPFQARDLPPLHLLLRGTNFQLQVWQALLRIPVGCVVSYRDVATGIGRPGAVRAVGRAIAENPVAYLIPCHRVIRRVGDFGGYRWGAARKMAILGWEAAHRDGS